MTFPPLVKLRIRTKLPPPSEKDTSTELGSVIVSQISRLWDFQGDRKRRQVFTTSQIAMCYSAKHMSYKPTKL